MTSPLDAAQVRRAVAALLQHNGTGGGALDLGAQQFTLQLGLRRAPQDPSPKPRVVALPHALHSSEGRQRCLIVKDCDKPWLKALTVEGEAPGPKKPLPKRDGTRAAKMARRATPSRDARAGAGDLDKVVDKVLALSKLRTSYKQFAARRELRDRAIPRPFVSNLRRPPATPPRTTLLRGRGGAATPGSLAAAPPRPSAP